MLDALEILQQGIEILNPVLLTNGFVYVPGKSGTSGGGDYAYGAYIRGDRRLERHFRHGLGLVTYPIRPDSLRHEMFGEDFLPGDGHILRNCVREARAAQRLKPVERMEQGWPDSIEET
jgi:hypothetical protein